MSGNQRDTDGFWETWPIGGEGGGHGRTLLKARLRRACPAQLWRNLPAVHTAHTLKWNAFMSNPGKPFNGTASPAWRTHPAATKNTCPAMFLGNAAAWEGGHAETLSQRQPCAMGRLLLTNSLPSEALATTVARHACLEAFNTHSPRPIPGHWRERDANHGLDSPG